MIVTLRTLTLLIVVLLMVVLLIVVLVMRMPVLITGGAPITTCGLVPKGAGTIRPKREPGGGGTKMPEGPIGGGPATTPNASAPNAIERPTAGGTNATLGGDQ
jgi:hypothetical protein